MSEIAKVVAIPKDAWDVAVAAELNTLKRTLAGPHENRFRLTLDFSRTRWMEPTSLMILACLLRSHEAKIEHVHFLLGDLDQRQRYNFLRFLAHQNFLACLFVEGRSTFTASSAGRNQVFQDLEGLDDVLQGLDTPNAFKNQSCIQANVFSVADFTSNDREHEQAIYELTEQLIEESGSTSSGYSFYLNDYSRDRFFQRLRKFLFEAIQNCVEHAYRPDQQGYFAVYARVRQGVPKEFEQQQAWHDLYLDEQDKAAAIGYREVNINSEWLEIFVVDTGLGLSRTARSWSNSEAPKSVLTKLARLLVGNTPLKNLGEMLFSHPFSSHGRKRGSRTNVTGFQEIARTLKDGGGYLRISTGLETVGGQFPWNYPNAGDYNQISSADSISDTEPTGTALLLTMQPQGASQKKRSEAFSELTPTRRDEIFDRLKRNKFEELRGSWRAFDKRFTPNPRPAQTDKTEARDAIRNGDPVTLYIRLTKGATKRDVGYWLSDIVVNVEKARLTRPILNIVFIDLYPFNAELLAELVERIKTESYINSISIVSITLDVACFERRKNRYQLSKPMGEKFLDTNEGALSLVAVLQVLREMDSEAFWTLGNQVPIAEAYIPANVKWTTSSVKPVETEFFGYLDFSQALVDDIRSRICRRALLRVCALTRPNQVQSTDELTSRLVEELKVKSVEVLHEEGVALLVSSVIVTGSTLKRFTQMSKFKNARQLCFFNRIEEKNDFDVCALLDWTPPPTTPHTATYKRISGTPFVSVDGDYAIGLSRLLLADDSIESHYARDTQKTYLDFDQYKTLQIGHWEAGRRHEFFNFRSEKVIEQCVLFNSEPWRWFKAQILECLEDKQRSWLILYPGHHTSSMIASSLVADPKFKELLSGRLFPINFLRERHIEPYFISPISENKITEAMAGQSKPVSVLIFDDAVISSKTMRAVSQIADHCSVKATGSPAEIRTLALLDRSGMPAYGGVMHRFTAKHRRYWRWDVPGINDGNHCPICVGLDTVEGFTWKGMGSRRAARVTASWQESWALTRASERGRPGHAAPTSERVLPIKMKFGVLRDGDQWRANYIFLKSAEALASSLVELTRLTHRADIAVRKSQEFSKSDKDLAAFVLCSVYIHMTGALRYWERLAYLRLILENSWEQPRCNEISKLSGLLMLSMDKHTCLDMYETYLKRKLSTTLLRNEDIAVALGMIIDKHEIKISHPPRGTPLAKNTSFLGKMFNGIDPFRDLFDLIGESGKTHHYSPLGRQIKTFLDKKAVIPPNKIWGSAVDILNSVVGLKDILEQIDECDFEPSSDRKINVARDIETLEATCLQFDKAITGRKQTDFVALCDGVYQMIYNNGGTSNALCTDYRDAFFKVISPSAPIALLLEECRIELVNNWEEYRQNKPKKLVERWDVANGGDSPSVFCGMDEPWNTHLLIFFDETVKGAIVDVLQNVIHSPEAVENPWTRNGPEEKWKAHIWWRARVEGEQNRYLRITIVTGSDGALNVSVNENKTSFQSIRACGGEVHQPEVRDGLVYVDVDLPVITKEG